MNHVRIVAMVATLLCIGAANAVAEQRAKPQSRPHGAKVAVDPSRIIVDDGDSALIRWSEKDEEIVRILGIDTPETRHLEHDIPYHQSHGPEAAAFARGAFAAATDVQLLRAATLDPYGRSLAYVFLNGRNYSLLVIRAHLAYESVSQFGDNGFPAEAAEVAAAAKAAGPLVFEPPHLYRARMRDVSAALKAKGLYPKH
jgi:micrococcal nuclease